MPISATIRGVLATSAALLGFAAAIPVQAQTAVDPGDYTALPPGTDLALVGVYLFNESVFDAIW